MEISKVIKVPVGWDFKVRGMSEVFTIQISPAGHEYISVPERFCGADGKTYAEIINAAPEGITALPPDMTDDEMAQLGNVYSLGGRYMVYSYGRVFAYSSKPVKTDGNWGHEDGIVYGRFEVLPVNSIVRFVSPEDDEPFEIARYINRGDEE